MPNGPDPYGDFSFEEVGGEAVAAPSQTPSLEASPEREETEHWPEFAVTEAEYEDGGDATDIEGVTPFGASFRRGGN